MSDMQRDAITPYPRSMSQNLYSWKFFHFKSISSIISNVSPIVSTVKWLHNREQNIKLKNLQLILALTHLSTAPQLPVSVLLSVGPGLKAHS